MKKAEALAHWKRLPENLAILPHFNPIPYKSRGSSYGACGIRVDGNPEFVDAVLSRLKDLIDGENHVTRLELARSPVDGSSLGKRFDKAEAGAEVCYVRLHERGREGSIASAVFERGLDGASKRFAKANNEVSHE